MLSDAYQRWRASELGRITDDLEHALLLELAGSVRGKSVLDIGCGDGALAVEFARRGAIVTCVDADPAMLSLARARAEQAAPLRLVLGQAEKLPFADAQFDLVMASTLLCLVRDPAPVMSEMARVLKPHGRVLIGELGKWSVWNLIRRARGWFGAKPWRDAHFYNGSELGRLPAQAGLETIATRGSVYYPPMSWTARLMAPADRWLGQRIVIGAAFLAVAAIKPAQEHKNEFDVLDCDQTGERHCGLAKGQ